MESGGISPNLSLIHILQSSSYYPYVAQAHTAIPASLLSDYHKTAFIQENIIRINSEIAALESEEADIRQRKESLSSEVEDKNAQIDVYKRQPLNR